MAEKEISKLSDFQSPLEFFEHYVKSIASKLFANKVERFCGVKMSPSKRSICSFPVMKPTRRQARQPGSPGPGSDLIVKTDVFGRLKLEELNALHNEICQCVGINKYFTSSYVDQYQNIHIVLNRTIFIKDVFTIVISCGLTYGQSQKLKDHEDNVSINCTEFTRNGLDGLTVERLRGFLLCNHMAEILKQKRWKVDMYCPGDAVAQFQENVTNIEANYFGISNLIEIDLNDEEHREKAEEIQSNIWHNLLVTPHRITTSTVTDRKFLKKEFDFTESHNSINKSTPPHALANSVTSTTKTLCENIWLNMTKFVEDSRTVDAIYGNELYSFYKAVKHVNVSSIWDDVLYLELLKHKSKSKVIHVCCNRNLVHWQKVALAWSLLSSSENSVAKNQIFGCHAGFAIFSSSKLLVHELLRIRTKQVKQSYIMKYGSIINDRYWMEIITRIAVSVIKLEIMLVPLNSQVKLDVSESDDCPATSRQALFVLYNCARLAKILEKFDGEVAKGVYPALPAVADIDFSLLNDQVEWDLVLKYVASYPTIVANIGKSLDASSILINFSSNKIAQFLVSLSQDISSYYSRVHILAEAREHLYPVIFARLYLVKVLYQVMQNALQLLSIKAIDQM